ncbi:MAG: hypothetical protein RMY64_33240 [Nostoc sp. DedQUE08]|uniref:hypothetical protein n=1 Tax=Nostoc sp. DedQUE08 TaxID=3075393 RepID=UPI002AD421A2|nr:hypothetical protein [Nostoc sp. DedQUE08]MDZ8070421.1 hypothetical protein [Nostoc sp. DedQUE08]
MKYSIELLNQTTKLILMIQDQLDCSFDEACEVAKIIFRQVRNKEQIIDNSLKSLLPGFLEEVINTTR